MTNTLSDQEICVVVKSIIQKTNYRAADNTCYGGFDNGFYYRSVSILIVNAFNSFAYYVRSDQNAEL